MPHPPVRALIFDFDGLIVDTESPVFESWRLLYADHGHTLSLDAWTRCVGSDFGHYDPASELDNLCGVALDWISLSAKRAEISRQLCESSSILPGIESLLQHAEDAGLPRAIASSSPSSWVLPWLDRLGISHRFHAVRTLDHVPRPKPDPALFLSAAAALGVAPEEALVFEDSLNGLRAANAAGMRCVVIPGPVTAALDFSGAALQLPSLHGLSLQDILDALATSLA